MPKGAQTLHSVCYIGEGKENYDETAEKYIEENLNTRRMIRWHLYSIMSHY